MKILKWNLLSVIALALIGSMSGCGVDDTLGRIGDELSDRPLDPVTSCDDLGGRYQMNRDHFDIQQDGCRSVTRVDLPNYWNDEAVTTEYLADGVERTVPSQLSQTERRRKAYFKSGKLTVEDRIVRKGSTTHVKTVYSLTLRPCDLMNPSGETYLQAEITTNGNESDKDCVLWERVSF